MKYLAITLIILCIAAVVSVGASRPAKAICPICKAPLKEKGFECQYRLNGKVVQVCFEHGFSDAWKMKFDSLRKK